MDNTYHLATLWLSSSVIVAVIFFLVGKKAGYKNGFDTAKRNSHNLVSQLKDANIFAGDLRDGERREQEEKVRANAMN